MEKKTKKIIAIFFLCFLFFIVDRLFKSLCFAHKKIFFLECQQNPYFLFFIKNDLLVYLMIIVFLIIVFLLIKKYQEKKVLDIFCLNFILLGGFSNFLDRIKFNYVFDYFSLFSLSVFNLADLMILIGAFIFVIKIFKEVK